MADERVQEIYDEAGKRRVLIFQRRAGSFYYQEEHFSEHPSERCWVPSRRNLTGIYESQKRAESEARANIDWLATE